MAKAFGDGRTIIDYGKTVMNVDAEHRIALQGIHSVVHAANHIGTKYTWFVPGYLSNMYFKMIANHPKYMSELGGDLSFTGCNFGGRIPIFKDSIGATNGDPIEMTGW